MQQLPKGYYAVQADFENAPKDSFTYRGVTYAVTEGVNLFGTIQEANGVATEIPDTVLEGLPYESFSAPVLLFSTGTHCIDKTAITASRILLGERAGISPSLPAEKPFTAPPINPERVENIEKESVLYGGYWYGSMNVTGANVPLFLMDGFVMNKARIYDYRASGECDAKVILRNLYHPSPYLHDLYFFQRLRADSAMHREVLMENIRLEKDFKELGYGRMFMFCCTNKITFRNVCIEGTTLLFGMTQIPRDFSNCAQNSDVTEINFEDCYIEDLRSENGIATSCDNVGDRAVILSATNCAFINASRENEAPLQPHLANDKCELRLSGCRVADTRGNSGPAIAIYGDGENVKIENCQIEGFATTQQKIQPPPAKAPDKIENKKIAWTTKTADAHRVIGTNKADFSALDAYYEGCKAYYGDQHTHSNSGGTSDGHTPIGEWVAKMDEVGMDFAILVDHRQMRGFFLPEWSEERFVYGTEPGGAFSDRTYLPNKDFHYNMVFPHKYGLAMLLANFPEYKFQGDELTGKFTYPKFTTDRMKELNTFLRSIGGMLVHAHPKVLLASEDPLDYYFGEHSYLEVIVNAYNTHVSFRSYDTWEQILALGKHMFAAGGSDTHSAVTNACPSTFYTKRRFHKDFVDRMYVGDYAVGGVGLKMMIDGHPMGSEIVYKDGMKLTLRVADFHRATWKENTAYELQVITDEGVAYASMFNGKEPQELSLEVQKRKFYRVVVNDLTHGYRVCVGNPIWLDKEENEETAEI